MKKVWVIGFAVLGLLIIITAISPFFIKEPVFSPEILEPDEEFSYQNIQTIWDLIFNESSEGIIIQRELTQNKTYLAFKASSPYVWLLYGVKIMRTESQEERNITSVVAAKFQAMTQYVSIITDPQIDIKNKIPLTSEIIKLENIGLRTESIELESAKSEFNSIFSDLIITNFEEDYWQTLQNFEGHISYINGEVQDIGIESNNSFGVVFRDYELLLFINNKFTSTQINCTPNWTEQNQTFIDKEEIRFYYIDKNNCNTTENRPVNKTSYKDFDNNRLIGNLTNFNSSINLKIYINDNPINLSTKQNKTRTVKLKEGGVTRAKFDWNFDDEPLNIKNITMKKQSNDNFGYLIINGIEKEKTLEIDRLKEADYVCIRDSIIGSISEVSSSCDESSEYFVSCPGNKSRFTCNITNSTFIVSGARHSAVKEFTGSVISGCTPNWNCTNWTICINDLQRRICIDDNKCNNNTGKPVESRNCTSPCAPNWNCTNWMPEECPKNETQTRSCLDKNNCNSIAGKPSQTQACTYESSYLFLIIIIILLVLILITIIFILRKAKQPKTETFIPPSPYYPTPPSPLSPPVPPQFQQRIIPLSQVVQSF